MPVVITATEQDVYPPRVLLSVTGLTIGDGVRVYREVTGERTLVRGADEVVTDTALVRVDGELPFGIPIRYVAVVNDAVEYSTGATVSYVLPGGKVVLSDAITGAAAELQIGAWGDKTYSRSSTRFKVGGRNVVVSNDWGQYESTLEVVVETTSSRDNLVALLETATDGIILVRQFGGYDGVDAYLAVDGAAERRFSQDGTDERRIWVLQVAETEPWSEALEARGYTLQDIADFYGVSGTLQDIADDFTTLLSIAQGDFS